MSDTPPAPRATQTSPSVADLVSAIVGFVTHRQTHKLAGTALAAFGLVTGVNTSGGWKEVLAGLGYAAAMHITGGLKTVPD